MLRRWPFCGKCSVTVSCRCCCYGSIAEFIVLKQSYVSAQTCRLILKRHNLDCSHRLHWLAFMHEKSRTQGGCLPLRRFHSCESSPTLGNAGVISTGVPGGYAWLSPARWVFLAYRVPPQPAHLCPSVQFTPARLLRLPEEPGTLRQRHTQKARAGLARTVCFVLSSTRSAG